MATQIIHCKYCESPEIVRYGTQAATLAFTANRVDASLKRIMFTALMNLVSKLISSTWPSMAAAFEILHGSLGLEKIP